MQFGTFLLTALVSATVSTAPAQPLLLDSPESLDLWRPQMGDRFIVDTKDNIGYLIHPNGSYAHFPVITGQNRVVNYIGRTYKATTPTREWVAGSSEVKGDRVTFGPSGRFLRLYYEDESTPYGIHEHRSEVVMFEREDRYQSMGCVIVKTFIMDLMVRTFAVNEGKIQVETIYGYSPEGTETLAANI